MGTVEYILVVLTTCCNVKVCLETVKVTVNVQHKKVKVPEDLKKNNNILKIMPIVTK